MKMYHLFESQIESEITICFYCGDEWNTRKNYRGCCGEVHPAAAFLLIPDAIDALGYPVNEDILLEEQVLIVPEPDDASQYNDIKADLELDQREDK